MISVYINDVERPPKRQMFSTLSGAKVVIWILSHLNMLCTGLRNHTTLKITVQLQGAYMSRTAA